MNNPEKKTSTDSILLVAGLFISILAALAMPNAYFHKDLEVFWQWAQVWNRGWQEIYLSCSGCVVSSNYPILGMFGSAGLLGMLSGWGFDKAVYIYRFFLAIVDGLNVWLVFLILKKLGVQRPIYLAGIIGISISSWAGGALWGQIDGLSQFFILLSVAWIIGLNTDTQTSPLKFRLSLSIGGILLACVLLVKQLTIFSAFSLGLLLLASIFFQIRSWKTSLLNCLASASTFLATILAWDFFLRLKSPYVSHLYYIWREGTYEGNIIAANGFNIWMFLGRDMWSSAQVPFFSQIPFFTPYATGMFLFFVFTAVITLALFLFLKNQFLKNENFLNKETLLAFLFHLALVNLCATVFLTGTRDRYLFHFYPYIIIAWAGLSIYNRLFSEKILSVLILGASLYGIFILQILSSLDFRIGTSTHLIMAFFHLCLFGCLLIIGLKYQDFYSSLLSMFKKRASNQ